MIGNVFKIQSVNTTTTLTPAAIAYLPDQLKERDEQWYLDNVRYAISMYNSPNANTNNPGATASDTSPVALMMKNLNYVLGEQEWGQYSYLVNATANSKVFWRKNRKIATIMDKMSGAAADKVSKIVVGAKPLSPDAVTTRMEHINVEMFKYKMKPLLDKHPGFKVADPAKSFQSEQEIDDWGSMNVKEHLADMYTLMGEHIFETRQMAMKSEFWFMYATACGLAAAEVYVDNGKVNLLWHPSYSVIYDNRKDQRYGEEMRFGGVVENMTLTSLYNRYRFLPQDVKEDLNMIAQSPSLINQCNVASNGITWWTANPTLPPNYKDAAISVVRVYWIASDEKETEIERLYMAEVIGNKYMVNYGQCNNVVPSYYTTYSPAIPIIMWTPNMLRGELNALISRMTDLSDEYELYRAKIRQLIAHSKGKMHIFRGGKLGANDSEKDILDDFTDLGIHVVQETGDPMMDKIPLHDIVDMTLDPNIQGLIEINKLVESELESYANQTKISLGEQTQYVGSKAFSSSMDQSALGTANLYDGLMYYMAIILRYMVNMQKNIYAAGENDWEARQVLGDDGLALLKASKNKYAEEYLIYLGVQNSIPQDKKDAIEKLFLQSVGQPQVLEYIHPIIKMMKAKNWDALTDIAESMANKIEQKNSDAAQQAQEAQARSQMAEQQHETETTSLVEQGKNVRKNQDITIKEQKLEIDRLKLQLEQAKAGVLPQQ